MNETDLIRELGKLVVDLPETISRDDLRHHEWLRKLVLIADDISNRTNRDDLHAIKSGATL